MQLPYRPLIPRKIDNLLIAGRAISGGKVAHATTIHMTCCAVLGKGAGVAAALSVKHDQALTNILITELQRELKRQVVRID